MVAGAQSSPQLNALAGASRGTQFFFAPAGPTILPVTILQSGLDASWEIDLFGRIVRGRQAALAQAESSERA